MTKQISEALSNIAVETFEQLAFMFAFARQGEDALPPGSALTVVIPFRGPFRGVLRMKISTEIVEELAANMLGAGDDEKTTPEQQQDALKETLNVICGNLLPAIAGTDDFFDIGPPELAAADNVRNAQTGSEPVGRANLAFDEGRCSLELFVDRPFA